MYVELFTSRGSLASCLRCSGKTFRWGSCPLCRRLDANDHYTRRVLIRSHQGERWPALKCRLISNAHLRFLTASSVESAASIAVARNFSSKSVSEGYLHELCGSWPDPNFCHSLSIDAPWSPDLCESQVETAAPSCTNACHRLWPLLYTCCTRPNHMLQ